MLVLYSHQHALTGLPEPKFIGIHSYGGLGVMIFFSISGFLVTQSWQADPNVLRFAVRRMLRIWPGYAIAIFLSVAFLGPWVSDLPWREYIRHPQATEYLRNFFFQMRSAIPAEFRGSALPFAVNGSLWTIPLELQCYALFAIAGVSGLLARRAWIAATTVAVALYYAGWQLRGEDIVSFFKLSIERQYLIEFGACFFFGTAMCLYWEQLRQHRAVLAAACACLAILPYLLGRPVLAGLLAVPAVAIAFGTASWPFLRGFDQLGDLSYGIYLYAFPVQQTIIWSLGDRMEWWPRLILTTACTLVCAFVSWHLIEKRALTLKPRSRKGRRICHRDSPSGLDVHARDSGQWY